MNIKLLTEQHLEFRSLKGGYTGLSESIHVKMPHCWKSHVVAQMLFTVIIMHTCGDMHNFDVKSLKLCYCIVFNLI